MICVEHLVEVAEPIEALPIPISDVSAGGDLQAENLDATNEAAGTTMYEHVQPTIAC